MTTRRGLRTLLREETQFEQEREIVGRIIIIASIAMLTGCAGTATSSYVYRPDTALNVPLKSAQCYDASVTLGADANRTRDIARMVMAAFDTTIEEDVPGSIHAQRNRHIGVFIGSGGEEMFVNWTEIAPNETFVTVTTQTGFVGGAGQKPWSCQFVDEMVKLVATRPQAS